MVPRVPHQIWSCRSLSVGWAECRAFQGCSKTGLAVLFLASRAAGRNGCPGALPLLVHHPSAPAPFLQDSGGLSTASLLWGCFSQLFSSQQCVQSVRGCSDVQDSLENPSDQRKKRDALCFRSFAWLCDCPFPVCRMPAGTKAWVTCVSLLKLLGKKLSHCHAMNV